MSVSEPTRLRARNRRHARTRGRGALACIALSALAACSRGPEPCRDCARCTCSSAAPERREGDVIVRRDASSESSASLPLSASPLPSLLPKEAETERFAIVEIDGSGAIRLDGRGPLALSAVLPWATVRHTVDPKVKAMVASEPTAPYALVIQVLDQLKQAGIDEIVIGTPVHKPAP
ncbi:MAG: hypothetical protein U0414_23035 [Polyangiaceae bacterium]